MIIFNFKLLSPNVLHKISMSMKTHLKNIWIILIGGLLTISCQESQNESPKQLEQEIDTVVEIITNQLLFIEISGGDEIQPFSSSQIEDSQNSSRISLDDNSERSLEIMISCIQSLSLDQNQKQEIRRFLFGLGNCQTEVLLNFRKEIREIISDMEKIRQDLLAKLRNGEIKPEEFRKSMEELREKNKEAISNLRSNYKEEIKPCIRGFVAQLPITMGRENWEQFMSCIQRD